MRNSGMTGEGLGGAGDEGEDGLCARLRQDGAPEGAGGFLVVGVGVVAGDAEQHGRHTQRERDLAGGESGAAAVPSGARL